MFTNPYIIFSVFNDSQSTATNFMRHMRVFDELKEMGWKVKQVGICVDGNMDSGMAVELPVDATEYKETLKEIHKLLTVFDVPKEAIYVNSRKEAMKTDLQGGVTGLGEVVKVTENDTILPTMYLVEMATGTYYIFN